MWLESVLAMDNFYKDSASDSGGTNKRAYFEEISLPHLC